MLQKLQKKAEKLASKDDELLEKERRRMSFVPQTTEGAGRDRRARDVSPSNIRKKC
jgi:hypothetical protein